MPASRDYSEYAGPLGPYRDKRVVDLSGGQSYENERGFTCQVSSAGAITYRTLFGDEDQTEAGLAAGASIVGPGGVPVVLRAVRSTSTVTGIVIGIL